MTNKRLFLDTKNLAKHLFLSLTVSQVLLLTVMSLANQSFAAPLSTTLTTNTNSTNSKNSTFRSRFSFNSALEYSARFAEDEQAKREQSVDLTLMPGFKVNDLAHLSVRTILTKENMGSQETQSSDTVLSLNIKGVKINETTKTLHTVHGVIPTSEKSIKQDRLQGAFGFSNGIHFSDSIWEVTYRLGYNHFIHEYNLNADGSANMQQSLSNSLSAQYKFTDKLYLTVLGVYRWGQTYGKKERSAYEIHSDLNYDLTGKMTLNIGTSSAGQALKANGVDSNIAAFDRNKGIIRAGISMSL